MIKFKWIKIPKMKIISRITVVIVITFGCFVNVVGQSRECYFLRSKSYDNKTITDFYVSIGNSTYHSFAGSDSFTIKDVGQPTLLNLVTLVSAGNYSYTHLNYKKGQYTTGNSYYQSDEFYVDDPIYIVSARSIDDNMSTVDIDMSVPFHVNYGAFHNNGNISKLKCYSITAGAVDYPVSAFDTTGGSIVIDFKQFAKLYDIENSLPYSFEIVKKLKNNIETFGNSVMCYFYDMPYISDISYNLICRDKPLVLNGKYHCFSESPNADLQVSNDKGTTWVTISKKLQTLTTIYYSDLYQTNVNLGKELWIRPAQTFHEIVRYGNTIKVLFLPSTNMNFSPYPQSLACNGDKLDSIVLKVNEMPSKGGMINPGTNDSIPLIITVYQYGEKDIASSSRDKTYKSISFADKTWYYQHGQTIDGNFKLTNINNVVLKPNMFQNLSLGAALYEIKARYNTTNATCDSSIQSYLINEPALFEASAEAVKLYHTVDKNNNIIDYHISTGDTIGTVKLKFSGGTLPYIYEVSSLKTDTLFSNPDSVLLNITQKELSSADYSITIQDAHNCKTKQCTITLKRPPDVTLKLSSKKVSCNAKDVGKNSDLKNNGEIVDTISGGVPPYHISIKKVESDSNIIDAVTTDTTGSFQHTNNINISAQTYRFEVVDSLNKDAIWSKSITVESPDSLMITIKNHNPQCADAANGSLDLRVTGGNFGYNYIVKMGTSLTPICDGTLINSKIIDNLIDTTYSIIVSDNNTCTKTVDATLIDPPQFSITQNSITRASCAAAANGTLRLTVNNYKGDKTNILFKDNVGNIFSEEYNKDSTYTIKNLANGDHTINVTDENNCKTNVSTNIPLRNPVLSLSAQTTKLAPCKGKYGEVTIRAANGEGDYTFTVDNKGYPVQIQKDSVLIRGLKSNMFHDYKVSDGICEASIANDTVGIISNPIELNKITEADISPAYCLTSSTGEIAVSRKYGTGIGNIQYYISPQTGAFSNGKFTALPVGTYIVTAQDDSLCEAKSDWVTVPVSPQTLALTYDNIQLAACELSSPTGKLRVMSNGTGFGNITFDIDHTTNLHEGNEYTFENLYSGDHILSATDGSGCTAQITGVVGYESNPVSLASQVKDQTCNEISDAQITVSATTRTAGTAQLFQYEFDGKKTGWITDTIYQVGKKGLYTIKVTDKDNCGTSADIMVNNLGYKPLLQMDHADSVACLKPVHPNGKLWMYVNSNHSQPPFIYRMSGKDSLQADEASTLVSFDSLGSGIYKIGIQDKLGCRDSGQFTVPVTANPVHITKIDTTSASCVAAANGKAIITAASFKTDAPYSFVCNKNKIDGNGVVFADLPVNSDDDYQVTVNDKYGCSDDSIFVIRVRTDTLMLAYAGKTDAACPGSSDGVIRLIRYHGNPDYVFNITNGAAFEKNVAGADSLVWIPGLPADTYRVTVTDRDHCRSFVNNIAVNQPDTIRFLGNTWNYIKQKGDSDGYARAEVWKGNNKYNYRWFSMPDSLLIISGKAVPGDTLGISALKAGQYLLQVRDTANCYVLPHGWLEKEYTIAEPDTAFSLVLVKNTPVSCNGLSDGQFAVKAMGGWHKGNNYLYGFDLNSLSPEPSFSNIKSGTKMVIAKDTAGVTVILPVTTTQPDVLNASLDSSSDANCYGSKDGSIKLNISGGNKPYYKISADSSSWINGSSLNGLRAGSYTAFVKDTLGCHTSVKGILIGQPTDILLQASQIKESRCGFNNGYISASFSGGIPDYHYYWSSPDYIFANVDTNHLEQIVSGNYRLTVTDAHHCLKPFMFYVSDSSTLTIDTLQTADVSCWGNLDGGASIRISKGNPPYGITWPDSSHNQSVSGLAAGLHSVRVTDMERCKVFKNFVIGTPDSIRLQSYSIIDPLCEGVSDGQISINPEGGFGGYSYLWSNGIIKSTVKNLSPGAYQVRVTDSHYCFNDFVFKLKFQQPIHLSLGRNLALC